MTLNVDKTLYLPFKNNILRRPPFHKLTFTTTGKTYHSPRKQDITFKSACRYKYQMRREHFYMPKI